LQENLSVFHTEKTDDGSDKDIFEIMLGQIHTRKCDKKRRHKTEQLSFPRFGKVLSKKGKEYKGACGMSRRKTLRHMVVEMINGVKFFHVLKDKHGPHVVFKNEMFEKLDKARGDEKGNEDKNS
jgi:hypothetical protein